MPQTASHSHATSIAIPIARRPWQWRSIRDENWPIRVVGGVAKPSIEGWILALQGVPRTDAMSRTRAREQLLGIQIEAKSTADYVDIVEHAVLGELPHFGLPSGCESLRSWLAMAHEVLSQLVGSVT